MITGVGTPMLVSETRWNNPIRPIRSSGIKLFTLHIKE